MVAQLNPESRKSRLPTLTGMRFIAALMVFAFHLSIMSPIKRSGPDHGPFVFLAKNGGWIGVSFFFMLSGFILTWSARDRDTVGTFLRRRLVKIYPNHLVMFVITMALYAAATAGLAQAVPNLLLLQAWLPRESIVFSVNIPSWSLSCELLFYLAFPFLLRLVRRIPENRLRWWTAAVAVAIVCVPLVARLLPEGTPFAHVSDASSLHGQSVTQVWFTYVFPPVRLLDFVLGILLARLVLTGRWTGPRLLPAAGLVIVFYLVGLYVPLLFQLNAITVVPLALLIPAAATADAAGRRTAMSGPLWVWLGEVSFAFYLVHQVLLSDAEERFHLKHQAPVPTAIGLGLLALALSLVASWLLHAAVERPAMARWARRAAQSRPVQPSAR
ncbi:acyltransferase family protein [Streptomyces sp. NPDC053048]|uniref:acyltransferase family protein n=1 Tax=Streptomyces sp. NPDC053048 TaxID=3365694 RepID=UPI0037CEF1DC